MSEYRRGMVSSLHKGGARDLGDADTLELWDYLTTLDSHLNARMFDGGTFLGKIFDSTHDRLSADNCFVFMGSVTGDSLRHAENDVRWSYLSNQPVEEAESDVAEPDDKSQSSGRGEGVRPLFSMSNGFSTERHAVDVPETPEGGFDDGETLARR